MVKEHLMMNIKKVEQDGGKKGGNFFFMTGEWVLDIECCLHFSLGSWIAQFLI